SAPWRWCRARPSGPPSSKWWLRRLLRLHPHGSRTLTVARRHVLLLGGLLLRVQVSLLRLNLHLLLVRHQLRLMRLAALLHLLALHRQLDLILLLLAADLHLRDLALVGQLPLLMLVGLLELGLLDLHILLQLRHRGLLLELLDLQRDLARRGLRVVR